VDAHPGRLAGQRDVQGLALFGIGLVEGVLDRAPGALRILRLDLRDAQLTGVEVQRAGLLVEPVQRQVGMAGQGLAGEVGLQVQVQGGGLDLVVSGVAEGVECERVGAPLADKGAGRGAQQDA
jgi:hypothetical protein